MAPMSVSTTDYLDAVNHLPAGASLVFHAFAWDEYERLVEHLSDGHHLRVSFDRGRLEVMSPLPEHEEHARFIDDLVRVWADHAGIELEKRGSTTWKKRSIERGVEADSCYYVQRADRIIGKRRLDLESDPPPDIAVEIDVTNESLSKFPIYAALGVPEIWRYDGAEVRFYALTGATYSEASESSCFPGLSPTSLAEALEHSKTDGQTAALAAFRRRLERA
jgi:Uma2 family endonuclease